MYLEKIIKNQNLSQEETASVFHEIMSGNTDEKLISAFLMGLSVKGYTSEEVSGAVKAVHGIATKVPLSKTFPILVDTCGTGGDGHHTMNISTAAALILSALEIPIAKHGNRSVSSKSGSADVLEALGYPLKNSPSEDAQNLDNHGFCFLFAPNYHPSMRFVGPIRKALKVRTIFNIMGPLLNPCPVTHQAIGVYQRELVPIVFNALKNRDLKGFAVLNSDDGMDEISPNGATEIKLFQNGKEENLRVFPSSFGKTQFPIEKIICKSPEESKKQLISVLSGKDSYHKDICLMNAAFIYFLTGKAKGLIEATEICESALNSGRVFTHVSKFLNL